MVAYTCNSNTGETEVGALVTTGYMAILEKDWQALYQQIFF